MKDKSITINLNKKAVKAVVIEAKKQKTFSAGILRMFLRDLLEEAGKDKELIDPPTPRIGGNKAEWKSEALVSNLSNPLGMVEVRGLYEVKESEWNQANESNYSFQRYLRENLCDWLKKRGHDLSYEDMKRVLSKKKKKQAAVAA